MTTTEWASAFVKRFEHLTGIGPFTRSTTSETFTHCRYATGKYASGKPVYVLDFIINQYGTWADYGLTEGHHGSLCWRWAFTSDKGYHQIDPEALAREAAWHATRPREEL